MVSPLHDTSPDTDPLAASLILKSAKMIFLNRPCIFYSDRKSLSPLIL